MENVKALFIDCDGVLYHRDQCTSYDMVDIGFGKTFEQYHVSMEEFSLKHNELKHCGVRGVWNAVLALCNKYNIPFNDFAHNMVANTNYTRISTDIEMLNLLRQLGSQMPIYIVTNNSTPHLNKIFSCLNGGTYFQNPQEELNIHYVTIENTLSDGIFHSKKMKGQLTNLCQKFGYKPQEVLLLDDTESVREKALEQGLRVTEKAIEKPEDTKIILQKFLKSVLAKNTK